ncbi:MAG TPA: hypothetical protein VKE94_07430 [Gemmataceae bacterium]|nr:hypothetical protein [Gemmataceae bacterium]
MSTVGAGVAAASVPAQEPKPGGRKKMAIVTTEWRYLSHAWHMGERFLVGYPREGTWHAPPLDIVSAFVDQTPANDLSKHRAKEFGFKILATIAEAVRCGGDKLAVDAVLIICEHGDYPTNKIGQKRYPRYEFFKQVTDVFEKDGRRRFLTTSTCPGIGTGPRRWSRRRGGWAFRLWPARRCR